MKVSIIVPMFNLQLYIEETLHSIMNQSYRNWECILIDDGSTDHTAKIVKRMINKSSQCQLIQTQNNGVSSARNVGLEQAKGDYIFFVDGDDPLPVDALEILVESAVKQEADLVIGKMMHNRNGRLQDISTYKQYGVYVEGEKTLESNPEILHSIGPTAKLFHKNIIKDLRFPTELKFAEEHSFIVQAYQRSRKIYVVDKLVYNYMIRDKKDAHSTTQQANSRTYEFMGDLIQSHKQVFEVMRNQNSKLVQQYYYKRITEFIMWPLLAHAIKEKEFSLYEKLLGDYFQSSAHREMMEKRTFKQVYLSYVMKEASTTFYKNNNEYLMDIAKYAEYNRIERFVFTGRSSKLKYLIYKTSLKVNYFLFRVKRKLKRLMRK